MEHQKKEAMKTLEQAEELFKANDLQGALTRAEKARGLLPSLPGVLNVLVAYHVHAAAREKKLPSGETDWYYVLFVRPSSHPEVIKRNYKIFRLLTHPGKNKYAAAEGAFKLVEQAWRCINSSTTSPEPQITTSRRHPPPPPARSGDAKPKPATRNSDGNLVCPHCQAEFGCNIAVESPVLCKCQSCYGCAVITPENKFTACRHGLPPRHEWTSPPSLRHPSLPPRPGTAQATSFTQPSSSQSSIPNFLLCPFCATRNSYAVIDGLCRITCKQCGVPSSIKMDGASSNKGDQTGAASPPSSQIGMVMCRKCCTPYDGEIPIGPRILRRCKLCGSWASIKLEIKQITVYGDQRRTPAADLPNQTTPVVPGSGAKPSDSPTAGDLVR
ncbi:uncharacterized protein LOC103723393 [Phoenix dactylifera]|uniref:Uncharacterized protein LOC103723393 n=1 Tax=Phoenix dactylifera TaxID=42345 RepID=A0A8B7D3Z0_PHODC|nr:uncharacterized protein LOC103723393 [Phoenix dactylifera]